MPARGSLCSGYIHSSGHDIKHLVALLVEVSGQWGTVSGLIAALSPRCRRGRPPPPYGCRKSRCRRARHPFPERRRDGGVQTPQSSGSRVAARSNVAEVRLNKVSASSTDRARCIQSGAVRRVAFAPLCGVSPVEAPSGKTARHRHNSSGDRQANQALWRTMMVRLSTGHDATTAYVQRRRAEGKRACGRSCGA